MKSNSTAPWFCAQIGAREHYAIPRALHHRGRLAGLYTDFWAGPAVRSILPKEGVAGALRSRFHPDLARVPVQSCNARSLAWELGLRRSARGEGRYLGYCEVGRRFASVVRDRLSRLDLPPETIFFAYDTGALEAFAALRPRGVRCLLNQIDPNRVEVELVREEEKRWPGWTLRPADVPEEYFRRREEEWALADCVVVNSEFCRRGLIAQGVPAEKLAVVPLCYESEEAGPAGGGELGRPESTSSNARLLQVLFLGQVILRKGIQYLMEAARLLRDEPVRISVVGPIGIAERAVKSAPSNMTFHGRVGRDQAIDWYRRSDLFVLPTLSDGFALTQLEAMAHGLPVIATPACGEVVTDGVDGVIVPARDAEALAQAVVRYASNKERLWAHGVAARQKSGQFTLFRLAKNLVALEAQMIGHKVPSDRGFSSGSN